MARLGRIHDRILEAYAQIDAGTPADTALRNVFKRARDLGSKERAEVADTVYAMLRKKRLIEDRLERAAKAEKRRFSDLDKSVEHRLRLLALWALQGASLDELKKRDAYAFRRIPNAYKRIVEGKLPRAKRGEVEELAVELSLPSFVVERLVAVFGEARTRTIGEALDGRAPVTLRANRLKATRDELAERIRTEQGVETEKTQLAPDGLILPGPVDLRSWPLFDEGWCELQDEGSQLIALAVGGRSGESILDACAGAGGKSLALAATGADVTAVEVEKKKLDELKKRARRAGADITTKQADMLALPAELSGKFDAVLVDAPCTGTGVLRRSPDSVWRLTEARLLEEIERQKHLLTSALGALKPGGRLVYATCSVLWEENEAMTAYLLEERTDLSPLPLSSLWGDRLSQALSATYESRIGPGPTEKDPDGFYVAALQKRSV